MADRDGPRLADALARAAGVPAPAAACWLAGVAVRVQHARALERAAVALRQRVVTGTASGTTSPAPRTEARDKYIAAGLLRPAHGPVEGEPTPFRRRDEPTLTMDGAGTAAAAKLRRVRGMP